MSMDMGPGMDSIDIAAEMAAIDREPPQEISADRLAELIRDARAHDGIVPEKLLYEGDLLRQLCALAGMAEAWMQAKSCAEKDRVADAAAEALGVAIAPTDARGTIINGLDRAAHATQGLGGPRIGPFVQIAYDCATGNVLTTEHVSENDYTRYVDPDVITVCYACRPMTAERIADEIDEALKRCGAAGHSIGDRIKAARETVGLTQQQLADAIPSPGGRQQICNWERGFRTPRRETLERIAEICNTTPGKLMFGE